MKYFINNSMFNRIKLAEVIILQSDDLMFQQWSYYYYYFIVEHFYRILFLRKSILNLIRGLELILSMSVLMTVHANIVNNV